MKEASHGFERGFVAYTEQAKAELLGLDPVLLKNNEAVSEIVARQMAEGALARSFADIAIAVTGFAGPGGPKSEEGLVHFAIARQGSETRHRVEHFGPIGRGEIRLKSLKVLLDMLEEALEQA